MSLFGGEFDGEFEDDYLEEEEVSLDDNEEVEDLDYLLVMEEDQEELGCQGN